jgi:hypothetical protein
MIELENLNDYAKDLTSGDGTNGILLEIFKRLEITNGTCIEFGAADGVWNSNTLPLWRDRGWSALLLEPDTDQYYKLMDNITKFSEKQQLKVVACNVGVSPHPKSEGCDAFSNNGYVFLDDIIDNFNSIDNPVQMSNVKSDFDLLSIDVDGNDYYIWQNFEDFNPKCVVVEYNQTIPPNIDFVDDIADYLSIGASIKSLVDLGKSKNYSLVGCTGSNLIFIHCDYLSKLGNITTKISDLYDLSNLCCVVSSQTQASVYLTKRRPANYYMTVEKHKKEYGLMPDDFIDTNNFEDCIYKDKLYRVSMHYNFDDSIDSGQQQWAILDESVVFRANNRTYLMPLCETVNLIKHYTDVTEKHNDLE